MKPTIETAEVLENGDVKTNVGIIMVPGESSDEIRANARFLAAAPKMLDGLKKAVKFSKDMQAAMTAMPTSWGLPLVAMEEELSALINKIEKED